MMTRMKKAETKPFWMDDKEWERKYPQMSQSNIGDNVVSGVPDLVEVEKGDVVGAYTFKDGLLIYHFYKKDRKEIYDIAQAEMDRLRDEIEDKEKSDRLQGIIAHDANEALKAIPWWTNFETELHSVFSEVFKYQEHKVSFYKEVDSWSVMLPEPSGAVKPNKAYLEKPFAMLALRVEANKVRD
jgi:hypothetical protein